MTRYEKTFGFSHAQIMKMPREEFAKINGQEWLEYTPSKFVKMLKRTIKNVPLIENNNYPVYKKRGQEKSYHVKLTLINGYGGKCTCCGEHRFDFLTLEHVNRDGKEHREEFSGYAIYRQVIKENFPPRYTILCMNCNFATRFGKICPHKMEVSDEKK